MNVFITGTDTDVGKTTIAAWLCYHLKSSYWKPLQSGGSRDSEIVHNLTGCKVYPESYLLKEPLCPYSAAKLENISLDMAKIVKPACSKLIIEGAGGVLVPIKKDFFMIDLIKQLNIPVIIVAKSALGTINHTCLTIEALQRRNIPILGVILNGPLNQDSKENIKEHGKVKILDEFPPLKKLGDLINWPLSSTLKEVFYELGKP